MVFQLYFITYQTMIYIFSLKFYLRKAKSIDIIPKNEEKFITVIANSDELKLKVRFIDSFRFMACIVRFTIKEFKSWRSYKC